MARCRLRRRGWVTCWALSRTATGCWGSRAPPAGTGCSASWCWPRRTLRGTGEQVAKAQNAVAGKAPIKRNRFIQLSGTTHTVNRELEAKARALAGIKGYITNLAACPDGTPITADFVIAAYHRLFEIETSKPQCCHSRGLSASLGAPSCSVFMRSA